MRLYTAPRPSLSSPYRIKWVLYPQPDESCLLRTDTLKVCVVTGAARGLGYVMCKAFLESWVVCRSTEQATVQLNCRIVGALLL